MKAFNTKARRAVTLAADKLAPEAERTTFVLRPLTVHDEQEIADVMAEDARKRQAPAFEAKTDALRALLQHDGVLSQAVKDAPLDAMLMRLLAETLEEARKELGSVEEAFAALGGRSLVYAIEVVRRAVCDVQNLQGESGPVQVQRDADGNLSHAAVDMLGRAAIFELFVEAMKGEQLEPSTAGKS